VGRHYNPGEYREGERKVEIVAKVGARPAEYRAPSFSWACVDGEVKFDTGTTRVECNMVTVLGGMQLQRTDGAEHLMGGNIREALRIRGQLLPAAVWTDDKPASSLRPIVTRECGKVQAEIVSGRLGYFEVIWLTGKLVQKENGVRTIGKCPFPTLISRTVDKATRAKFVLDRS
jgi:hypothetical protein